MEPKVWIPIVMIVGGGFGQTLKDISEDPFIFQTDQLPENLRYMPSVGNGHLATVINTDTVYVNGLYNGRLGWSHRARIPALHASNISVSPRPDSRTHMLDIKNGEYMEELILQNDYKIVYRVYAHQFYNRLLVTEVEIVRQGNNGTDIVINRNSLTGNFTSIDIDFNASQNYSHAACTETPPSECRSMSGKINVQETDTSVFLDIFLYWKEFPDTLTLPAGVQTETWTFLFSMDQDASVAEENFKKGMDLIAAQESQVLLDMHRREWQSIWDNGYIELEGSNLELLKVVYGCFYYLYSFLPATNTSSPNNQFFGLSPGGLANGANWTDYQGHVFWDMETWMYPGILLFRPDLAREMLSYRVHAMDPAFQRAAIGGYQGTRFPWESALTGTEVTPDICPACREYQQHITGDIALAARQYIFATRDKTWLTTKQAPNTNDYTGLDFVHQMAKFWYTRPTFNLEKAKFEINGVMPPDEKAEYVDNSVYTNAGAMLSINIAKYAACLAGESNNTEYDVPERWFNVARNLEFMYDQKKRFHPEYEGYTYQIADNGTVISGMVKQADVVLLNFPYMLSMPDDVKRNDLEIYEALTDPLGPAMTWGVFSIGWLELDDADSKENAQRLLNKSYQLYMREPFKIWTEAQSGLGAINFITGMGGFLQTLLFGYGGLRLHTEDIRSFKPSLPEGITKMTFKDFEYLGASMNIVIDSENIEIKLLREGPYPINVQYDNTDNVLQTDAPVMFPHGEYRLYTNVSSQCSPPEDYITVDYSQPPSTTTVIPTTGGAVGAHPLLTVLILSHIVYLKLKSNV